MDAGDGAGGDEEVLDYFRDQPALARLGRLPKEGTQVQLPLRQALQRRRRDLAEALGIHVSYNPRLDLAQVHPAYVHLAEELVQQVRGEDLTHDIKDLVGAQLAANLKQPLEEL